LLVNEHLVQLHCHSKIEIPIKKSQVAMTLVMPCAVPPIFLTCRLVHDESIAIMRARLARVAHLCTVSRIVIPAAYASDLAKYNGLIDKILNMIDFALRSPQHVTAAYVEEEPRDREVDYGRLPGMFFTRTNQLDHSLGQTDQTDHYLVGWTEDWILHLTTPRATIVPPSRMQPKLSPASPI
jgi:hypothetical protein